MKRRTILATIAAITSGFAGCTNLNDTRNSGGDSRDSPPAITATPEQTGSQTPASITSSTSQKITETSFELVGNTCGTGTNEVSIEHTTRRVTVRGTISERNSCYTAALKHAVYDTDANELTIAVRSFSETEMGQVCGQCLVDIDYHARVSYDVSDPEIVTILHNGKQVYSEHMRSSVAVDSALSMSTSSSAVSKSRSLSASSNSTSPSSDESS